MLFNSIEFLVFFLAVFVLFAIGGKWRWLILLGASYFFYMAWKWEYIILILASTIIDFLCGRGMANSPDDTVRKRYLYLSIISNLGILITFKYFNFFIDSIESVLEIKNNIYLNVILPVGISFYTFQTMSYSVDVYHRRIPAEKHLGYFALYVAYFPQLVAGPIERAGHILHQFKNSFQLKAENVFFGAQLILWGLFKKVVIADRLALFVDPIFNNTEHYHGASFALASFFFGIQIYCDFSGYTDMAIGLSKMFNIDLIKNFDRPYFSKSISEFWKRWHISLSRWFRDYLYIPLGGNRVLKMRWVLNIMITFVLSGLWHGANWTFIIWGALHGIYLLAERFLPQVKLPSFFKILLTFLLVQFAWIFFRANNLDEAWIIISTIFSPDFKLNLLYSEIVKTGISELNFVLSALLIASLYLKEALYKVPKPFVLKLIYLILVLFGIILFGIDNSKAFIYFQF